MLPVVTGYAEGGTEQTFAAVRLWTDLVREGHVAFACGQNSHALAYPLRAMDFVGQRSSVLELLPYAQRVIDLYQFDEHNYVPRLVAHRLIDGGVSLFISPALYFISRIEYPEHIFFRVQCWGSGLDKRCRAAWSLHAPAGQLYPRLYAHLLKVPGWHVLQTKIPEDMLTHVRHTYHVPA